MPGPGGSGQTRRQGPSAAQRSKSLRLRQVQRIFALDVAAAQVVADGVADHGTVAGDGQRQLGFGHDPPRVAAQVHRDAGTNDAIRRRLEEQFRPLGIVDPVVEIAAAGLLALPRCGPTGCAGRSRRKPTLPAARSARAATRCRRARRASRVPRCRKSRATQAGRRRCKVRPRADRCGSTRRRVRRPGPSSCCRACKLPSACSALP